MVMVGALLTLDDARRVAEGNPQPGLEEVVLVLRGREEVRRQLRIDSRLGSRVRGDRHPEHVPGTTVPAQVYFEGRTVDGGRGVLGDKVA